MSLDPKELQAIQSLFNALDAKINAVAAYVSMLPNATSVDVKKVQDILRSWPTTGSAFNTPSPSIEASKTLTAIRKAADEEAIRKA